MSNMQQYGASKNPPWARNTATQAMPGMQQQQLLAQNSVGGMSQPGMLQYQQSQAVYQPNILQQQNMTLGMQMQPNSVGMSPFSQGQMFSQSGIVAYPTPRALNPNAFSNSGNVNQNQGANNSTKQRVFTGTVTKMGNDFGWVDEDIYFPISACVKGSNPGPGDRVLVEASYNEAMFKWNATRIQVLAKHKGTPPGRESGKKSFGMSNNGSAYNAVPPPGEAHNGSFPGAARANTRDRKQPPPQPARPERPERARPRNPAGRKLEEEADRGRKRGSGAGERDKERGGEKPAGEDKDKDKDKERTRSPSKQRKRSRAAVRYLVQVPKIALDIPEADVLEIRRRYLNLYIPSDFFNTQFRWIDAFPPNSPFTLNKPCYFHVMPKEMDNPVANDAVLEPPDVDYLFSAKVMLLSMPSLEELYRKCCGVSLEDKSKEQYDREFIHPTRLISFLVGLRGKNETMALGGPWSPSLDGPSPESDPTVLIKTAIRTCKAHTGIDLSNCTQWYRFVELYYRRAESVHRGRAVPARVETVVIFVPDVWSCLPARLEWEQLLGRLAAPPAAAPQPAARQALPLTAEKPYLTDNGKKEPTPYSELDPKTMSVVDLRAELTARNINSKGLKSQLAARLGKVLQREEAGATSGEVAEPEEDAELETADVITIEDEPSTEDPKEALQDEEKQKMVEKERLLQKAIASIPENPQIMVYPSRTAKSGKFDCTVMTLSLLLDYRQEDSKEHSFEVSLFAELFNEMLMRDFGFNIYKALCMLPDKPKEERKDTKEGKERKGEEEKPKDGDAKKADKKKEEKQESSPAGDSEGSGRERSGKARAVTRDAPLLLSFVYFDTTHCGYIFEKDMEELLFTLGLNLSRAQVRRLVAKVVTRDSFYYRNITDKPKEEENGTGQPEAEPEAEAEAGPEVDLAELAAGNKKLLPVFRDPVPTDASEPPKKRARVEDTESQGIITYKGSILDVEKLLQQLKRSEQIRMDTEARLVELKGENTRLQERQSRVSQASSALSTELNDARAKLLETQTQLSKNTMCTKIFYNALKDIDIKVQSVIHTNLYEDPEVKPKLETLRIEEAGKSEADMDVCSDDTKPGAEAL